MKFGIGLMFGLVLGATAWAGGENWPSKDWPTINIEQAVNVAFDPEGHAQTLKVDSDGRVIAHCE